MPNKLFEVKDVGGNIIRTLAPDIEEARIETIQAFLPVSQRGLPESRELTSEERRSLSYFDLDGELELARAQLAKQRGVARFNTNDERRWIADQLPK